VRWRNDGRLEHLGRLDDQVKVHGHRIELGEIEAVLADHDDVRQAVAAVKGGEGEARLVAFIVSEPGRPLIGSELRRFLRQRLPAYMVPGVISEIDAVPLAPNGKVDRKALPDPAAGATRREYAAPTTDTEQQIANVWKALLDVERVSIHDNFFEIGGHSLLAMRAVAMLAAESGGRIDPRAFFFQTLHQIAASIQARPGATAQGRRSDSQEAMV
jgi:hypothetical protein